MSAVHNAAFASQNPLASLDLSDAAVQEGLPVLRSGVYDAVVDAFEMKPDRNKNTMLAITFHDLGGRGQITQNLNLNSPNAEAKRISRDQLKTICFLGGHPDPDHPFGGGQTIKGLRVRIFVESDGQYTKNNVTRTSYSIKRFGRIDPNVPATGPAPESTTAQARGGYGGAAQTGGVAQSFEDTIPF